MASIFTPGASSMIFWCLLCTLQSLSNRYTALPCWSPNTCTSTCLNGNKNIQRKVYTDTAAPPGRQRYLPSWKKSQNGSAEFTYGVGAVTWGCPQTSPPAWRRHWTICVLLFWLIPAALEILLLSERYAFPAQHNTHKPVRLSKHEEDSSCSIQSSAPTLITDLPCVSTVFLAFPSDFSNLVHFFIFQFKSNLSAQVTGSEALLLLANIR